MILKPQWIIRKNNECVETTKLTYRFVKQTELMNLIGKRLEEVLKPYEDREDMKISIMLNDSEHFLDKPDGCSITCKIIIEPKKELFLKDYKENK